jgi:hypothetical protein
VCRESREHTLKHYRRMEHLETTAGSFYFNPSHDVLLLSMYYTDDQYYSDELKRLYNGQLKYITSVLMLDRTWVDTTPAGHIRKFLINFGGREIIRLLYLQGHHCSAYNGNGDGESELDHPVNDETWWAWLWQRTQACRRSSYEIAGKIPPSC